MARSIAELFQRLTTGVYVIGVADGNQRDAFTAAWLTQVSFDPLMVALSVNPDNASHALLKNSGCFAVTILKQNQLELARHFGTRSGADTDKLAAIDWAETPAGMPYLNAALAWLDCRVNTTTPAGDHELVLASVHAGELLDTEALPMRYAETGKMDNSAALFPASFPSDHGRS